MEKIYIIHYSNANSDPQYHYTKLKVRVTVWRNVFQDDHCGGPGTNMSKVCFNVILIDEAMFPN